MKQGLYESKMTLLVHLFEQIEYVLKYFDDRQKAKEVAQRIVSEITDHVDFYPIDEHQAIKESYQEYIK